MYEEYGKMAQCTKITASQNSKDVDVSDFPVLKTFAQVSFATVHLLGGIISFQVPITNGKSNMIYRVIRVSIMYLIVLLHLKPIHFLFF